MSDGAAAASTPFTASSAPFTATAYSQTPPYRRINSHEGVNSRRLGHMAGRKKGAWLLAASYVSDWIVLIIVGVVGYVLGDITPNKRPFSLEDPNIS